MNTRSSSVGGLNSSLNRGRGARSSSASRNNIPVEISNLSGTKSKVVHSPNVNKSGEVQRTVSTESLPSQVLFSDIQVMDNQNIPSQIQNLMPSSNRDSTSGMNPVPADNAATVPNTSSGSSLDSLMALMEQTMLNTREEFRRELNAIRDSISQIGGTNTSNRPPEFIPFIPNINTPSVNTNQTGPSLGNYSVNENNVKLEKWKISFDGTGSVSDFLFKVETLANRSKCSDEHLMSNFHILLDGKAEQWYWLFTKQNRNVTYPLLRHALTKEFGHIESDHEVILKISLRKQSFKECYDDFHSSIVSMNLRFQNPLPDPTLIDIIKRNLNPNLRFLLFNSDSRDLNEFRDKARKAEKVLRETRFQNPNIVQTRNVSEIEVLPEEDDSPETIDPQIEALKFSKKPTKYDFSNIQCWNCLLYGHSYIYCSKPIEKYFCFKCGTKGFLTPNCPNNHNYQGNQKMGDLATGDNRPPLQTPNFK
ncbi:uncharacterized protein LOC124419698 [Lucilia cuprina]|uniref:uncharacterized protein LOC124419698 n=1 Tax=Lucilia cuprina TaxID=7375 RepID=UPI001F07032C|nr:uncharacterized protein LOC124419698 [Lucilia cuprina]